MRIPRLRISLFGVIVALLLGLFVLGSVDLSLASSSCGGRIYYGNTVYDSIPGRGRTCDYFFSGRYGDYVTITMITRSSSLDPYLKLYDPYGYLVESGDRYDYRGYLIDPGARSTDGYRSKIIDYRLLRRGTYTIEADSYDPNGYGAYKLTLSSYRYR